jgi:hypothetical protein
MIICNIIHNIIYNISIIYHIITNHHELYHCKYITKIQEINTYCSTISLTVFPTFQVYLFSLLHILYYISLKICKKLVILLALNISPFYILSFYSLTLFHTFYSFLS